MPAPQQFSQPPAKKRKTAHAASIARFEEGLHAALDAAESGSLNALADLTQLAAALQAAEGEEDGAGEDLHRALYALYRVYVRIIEAGRLCGVSGESEAARVVRAWLNERVAEYGEVLCACLQHEQKGIRSAALQILFSLLKHLSEAFSRAHGHPQLHAAHFRRLVRGLLLADADADEGRIDPGVRDEFVETWLSVHDDVRWFFLREASTILRAREGLANPHLPDNVLALLERLTTMPTASAEINAFWVPALGRPPAKSLQTQRGSQPEDNDADEEEAADDWRAFFDAPEEEPVTPSGGGQSQRVYRLSTHESLHSLAAHRAQFTACWMALLPHIARSTSMSARALHVLHRGVMPHLDKPVRLMDWIGGCVDFGGSVGLLALNALFTLMQEYNLDYPNFYTRLYAFLTRDVLHLKHRARFFRLTEVFLSSTHLPATLLASFIKRLSRLSLSAPPAAIVMIIPFTYNILKRHPACMVMIHREGEDVESDPFDAQEASPYLTNALSSSLWELVSHRNHYHAPVATLARIFSEAFTKPGYGMEDFLDHTYGTLLETELKRKIKKEPAVAFELRKGMFGGGGGDVVSELWGL